MCKYADFLSQRLLYERTLCVQVSDTFVPVSVLIHLLLLIVVVSGWSGFIHCDICFSEIICIINAVQI